MPDIPNWILTLMQIGLTTIAGIVGFYIKWNLNDFKKLERDVHKQNEKCSKDISDFKLEVSANYVHKDDYNRNYGEIIQRLDKLQDMLVKALTK